MNSFNFGYYREVRKEGEVGDVRQSSWCLKVSTTPPIPLLERLMKFFMHLYVPREPLHLYVPREPLHLYVPREPLHLYVPREPLHLYAPRAI